MPMTQPAVLVGLNRALCGKFEEHFVTAALCFLWTWSNSKCATQVPGTRRC